jgi:glyoxylase-like metal-dependent hydrolase (beta-lactamase superfamily II)/rhodanese-related sulfurtransferase
MHLGLGKLGAIITSTQLEIAMQFQQIYLDCLAQASYLVGDGDECAIVDPRRDVEVYLEAAAARGMTISHVIETHLHADFVSGHVELARRTGAQIHLGHLAGAEFEHQAVHDGDEIVMGDVLLRFLETPGHTPESLCVLIFDRSQSDDKPVKVLTGDTLFIGDVGRPDLVGSQGYSAEQMAGMLYDSLATKLLVLPDETEVYPGHGAGSACGRNMSTERSSTIGAQKLANLALQPMQRDAFIAMQTAGLAAPPRYFSHSAALNKQGAKALDELPQQVALDADQVAELSSSGSIVLDLRDAGAFGAGHVPGSVNIGLDGNFAPWVGGLVDVGASLVLVADSDESVAQAVTRLARVGHEAVAGYLAGGVSAWTAAGRELATLQQITVDELAERLADSADALTVLDVRQPGEHDCGHVPGALNVPVREVEDRRDELDPERPLALICASGYRSSAAASQLARHGFTGLLNVVGGTIGWVEAGHAVAEEA